MSVAILINSENISEEKDMKAYESEYKNMTFKHLNEGVTTQ